MSVRAESIKQIKDTYVCERRIFDTYVIDFIDSPLTDIGVLCLF
jgi:hypothetical protein